MEQNFDIKEVGKRMPYTAPDGFLDDIENNVWNAIKDDMPSGKPKRNRRLWLTMATGLIAACVALLVIFNIMPAGNQSTDDFNSVEQAFAQLSNADQNYLLSVYQDDPLMNE